MIVTDTAYQEQLGESARHLEMLLSNAHRVQLSLVKNL
jgi:hypothetical protein